MKDLRLPGHEGLRTMATRVMAAACSTAVHLGRAVKRQVVARGLATAAERIFGVPELHLSAIAAAIK